MPSHESGDLFSETRAKRELDWFEGPCCLRERDWTEEEFLRLDQSQEPHFFEFSDGQIDFPGWPCWLQQSVCGEIASALHRFMRNQRIGDCLMGVCPIRLWPGRWACPDISWHSSERMASLPSRKDYYHGADGVMEVLSHEQSWREWDLVRKRSDYARAGIPEYWIVDPESDAITILMLDDGAYRIHGEFNQGAIAASATLPGFEVNVSELFAKSDPLRW
jgi:Uma2 family endonuclease